MTRGAGAADNSRPYLQTLHGESKDYTYINAVYVDGFTRKGEWIVTEWPKAATLDSLWALVFDHNAHTLVNLTTGGNPKVSPSLLFPSPAPSPPLPLPLPLRLTPTGRRDSRRTPRSSTTRGSRCTGPSSWRSSASSPTPT